MLTHNSLAAAIHTALWVQVSILVFVDAPSWVSKLAATRRPAPLSSKLFIASCHECIIEGAREDQDTLFDGYVRSSGFVDRSSHHIAKGHSIARIRGIGISPAAVKAGHKKGHLVSHPETSQTCFSRVSSGLFAGIREVNTKGVDINLPRPCPGVCRDVIAGAIFSSVYACVRAYGVHNLCVHFFLYVCMISCTYTRKEPTYESGKTQA